MDQAQLAHFQEWVGRTQAVTDTITPVPATLLAATIDRDDPPYKVGDAVPPNWHRLYFLTAVRPGEVGEDGHPRRGDFLPPIPLPRRMFAGGRLVFHRVLKIGDTVTRTSEIMSVEGKQGKSGDLVFVTIRHGFAGAEGLALEEFQDLVYREEAGRSGDGATRAGAPRGGTVAADDRPRSRHAVPLFRAHLQRSPHPLRSSLRDAGRGLSRPHRARAADRDAASRPRAPGATAGAGRRIHLPRPPPAVLAGSISRCAAGRRQTERPCASPPPPPKASPP